MLDDDLFPAGPPLATARTRRIHAHPHRTVRVLKRLRPDFARQQDDVDAPRSRHGSGERRIIPVCSVSRVLIGNSNRRHVAGVMKELHERTTRTAAERAHRLPAAPAGPGFPV
jgi:hypothetical protein